MKLCMKKLLKPDFVDQNLHFSFANSNESYLSYQFCKLDPSKQTLWSYCGWNANWCFWALQQLWIWDSKLFKMHFSHCREDPFPVAKKNRIHIGGIFLSPFWLTDMSVRLRSFWSKRCSRSLVTCNYSADFRKGKWNLCLNCCGNFK